MPGEAGGLLFPVWMKLEKSKWKLMHGKLVALPSLLDIFAFFCIIRIGMATMTKLRLENRLKVARAEKNISQEELANLAGVTRQTISSIETYQYIPSALLAFLLAKKLEKPVDELFFLEGDE